MNLGECFKSAFSSILSNKMRSLLTMLGIIIGISAVITITTLGSSLSATIENAFSLLGGNYVDVYIEPPLIFDEENGYYTYDMDSLQGKDIAITLDMLEDLNKQYPGRFMNAQSESYGSATVLNRDKKSCKLILQGAFEGYLKYQSFELVAGRNLTTRDNQEKRTPCLVSDIFVKQYFTHGEEPLGQTLSFESESGPALEFTIVGIYKFSEVYKKALMRTDTEDTMTTFLIVPFTTASRLIYGDTDYSSNYASFVVAGETDDEKAINDLQNFFNEEFKETPEVEVNIYSGFEELDIISTAINLITIVISVIAAISLLVGGVGLMNIMLVSVTERTREIGIRKALGAKRSNIKTQFLIEAIMICLIGGGIGIGLGILNGDIIAMVAGNLVKNNEDYSMLFSSIVVEPSMAAILISLLFSTLTGVFFGLYPAGKAAKMDPIEALRYD